MVWKETDCMKERVKFVLKVAEGELSIAAACRDFGISRTCGYKWLRRYKDKGIADLGDRSRKPFRCDHEVRGAVVIEIVKVRQSHSTWGARKIRRKLVSVAPEELPSTRTITRILERCGLIQKRIRRRRKAPRDFTEIVPTRNNEMWTIDFKGWWRAKDGERIEPLTIRDDVSKFILTVEPVRDRSIETVKTAIKELFQKYGLPDYIRCDNGTPWAFHRGLCGLTRLSVWWLELGITPLFTPLGSPQKNGSHERMHKDMAEELQVTPAKNFNEEVARLEQWRCEFNHERPHESLGDKCPAQVYTRSKKRVTEQTGDYDYPQRFHTRRVLSTGKVNWKNKTHFLSKAFADKTVAFEIVSSKKMNIWFREWCIAYTSPDFSAPLVEYNLLTLSPDMRRKMRA